MNLSHIDKYGFPFCWFIDTYDEINQQNANCLEHCIKNIIDDNYKKNYLNYLNFIDKIIKLLNISPDEKIKYLQKEIKCVLCNKNYPHSFEIFTEFIDFTTDKNINNNICYDCACGKYVCSNCNTEIILNELYEKIYIYTNKDNKNNKNLYVAICKKCKFLGEDLPLIGLLYKNIELNIEFNDLEK